LKRPAPDVSLVANVVQRLAVLLAAGVAPVAAWGYLTEGDVPLRVAEGAARGESIPRCLIAECELADRRGASSAEHLAWRGLAAAWAVATEAGAPLAATLRDFASSLRSLAQAQRDIGVALAAPVATARMVMVLPAVGVLFGMALGFNTLGTLFTTPVGWACLVVGGSLLAGAARWNRRLVLAAQPTELTPGLECDLTAIALSGGGSIDRARHIVSTAIKQCELPLASGSAVDAVLELSARAGVPAAELLRSEALELRRSASARVQARAASLAVTLMLPLGLCILPAFMVLGVLPLLVTVISSTVERF